MLALLELSAYEREIVCFLLAWDDFPFRSSGLVAEYHVS